MSRVLVVDDDESQVELLKYRDGLVLRVRSLLRTREASEQARLRRSPAS